MKSGFLVTSLIAGASLFTLPRALAEVVLRLYDDQIIRVEKAERMEINENGNGLVRVTYLDGTTADYNIADIVEMIFDEKQFDDAATTEPSDDPNVIIVEWGTDGCPRVQCSAPGVTATVTGGDVLLENTNVETEYTYVLRGKSENGSFTLDAGYKSTIVLDGVELTSTLEEAVNIKCGKRIALVVNDGTVNTLQDPTAENGQKAALYCKGHLEIEGAGELNLVGHVKHALSTKEYLQLKKKFTGTLNVLSAANDGIHAGQYFQMNGGNVKIRNVQGDGIQAEATGEEGEENDGMMIIKGGTIDIVNDAKDVKGLKASADVQILGGTVNIAMSGDGSRGIKADMNVVIGDEATGEGPVLSIATTGEIIPDETGTGGGTNPWWGPGGGGWGGGGGGRPGETSGTAAKAIKCGDKGCTVGGCYYQYGGSILVTTTGSGAEGIEAKASTATAMNFNGGNIYINAKDDGINSAGAINFNGANVICISTGNDAIDSNYGRAGSITITDGVVLAFGAGGAEMAFDCDNMAYVLFKGGIAVGGGGNQGGGSSGGLGSGSIHYKWWSTSISYQTGRYYSVYGGGANAFTFMLPVARSSSNNLYACDYFTSGTTYTLGYSTAAPTSGEAILFRTTPTDLVGQPMFWKRSNVTSGTQATTFSPS